MVCVIRIISLYRFCLCVFHRRITVGIFTGNLCNLGIYFSCFFRIALLRIEVKDGYNLCIAVISSKCPCYLYDGTVYLDAKEIFRATSYRDCCPEGDNSIDVWHGSCTDESVTFPGTTAIPCKIISCLIVLHDGRYSIIVICLGRLTVDSLLFGLIVLSQKAFPITLF